MRTIAEGFEKSLIKSWFANSMGKEKVEFYAAELAIDVAGFGEAGGIVEIISFDLIEGKVLFYNEGDDQDDGDETFYCDFNVVLEDLRV